MDTKTASNELHKFQRDLRAYIRNNIHVRASKRTISMEDLKSGFESKMGYAIGKYNMWFVKMIRATFKVVVNCSNMNVYAKTGESLFITGSR